MSQAAHDGGRERLTRAVAALSLTVSLVYITWRWGWTLNTEALWFSVPLALAETYGVLTAAFMTFTAWELLRRQPPAALPGRTVDVFVTTLDEPLTIVRKTALAARELRYPHATWLLDDGGRDEIRALAAQLGIGYLHRPDRTHGKAGNLNHALGQTSGELVLQLDADHVPLPHMLDRLVGFFADDRMAFVQSSQDFYNVDALANDVNGRRRQIWGDQELFYRVIQPGKDRVNAALLAGSCAVVRRSALDDIGGFATGTISEGLETSLQLHARGWRSAYLDESLAFGLAPASARAFHVRHLRWGQGAMQALRRYQPVFMPGLTIAQRGAYLDSLTTFFGGFQRLILYLAPIVFFATGVFPLQVSAVLFTVLFVPHLALRALSFTLLSRGHGSLLLADRLAMARFFTHARAVTGLVVRQALTIRVPKHHEDRVSLRTAGPQLAIVALTVAALGWALYERLHGYADATPGWGVVALWAMLPFALWNAALAANVIHLSLGGQHRRNEHRFAESLSVALRVIRPDNKLAASDVAVTENLTPSGLALRGAHPIPEGTRVEITLPLTTGEAHVRGRVVRNSTSETKLGVVHVAGVEFDNLSPETREAIELHCAHRVSPLEPEPAVPGAGALRRLRELRGNRRLSVGMPARVSVGASGSETELGDALLSDVSPRGGRVMLEQPVEQGSLLTLQVPGTTQRVSGRVVFVHAIQTGMGMRFVAGFATEVAEGTQKQAAKRWFDEVSRLTARLGSVAAAQSWAASAAVVTQGRVVGARALAQGKLVGEKALMQGRLMGEKAVTQTRVATSGALTRSRLAGAAAGKLLHEAGRQLRRPHPAPGASAPASAIDLGTPPAPEAATPLVGLTSSDVRQSLEAPASTTSATPVEPRVEEVPTATAVAPAVSIESPADLPPAGEVVEEDIDWTIDGEFTFPGELSVGGTFVVGAGGRVTADIQATNAVIHGEYQGTLKATGTIFVTPTARVTGVLESPEVVVLDGAVVNGHRAGEVEAPEPEPIPVPVPVASSSEPPKQGDEEEIFIPSPVHRQGKTLI
jgi:cellulose synthase (UDP-forming)